MQNVYTVGQINSYIKNMFAQDFLLQELSIKGEVSNCKYHSSGHIYFTLKDEKGTISCVMFAGNRSGLRFRMAEGMQVVVKGTIDVYERDGKYQMYTRSITRDGAGALYERFERLKQELLERGMFAPEYKKPIPEYVRTLGVVTAPTGAAVRDIINIASRRNPYVQIILYPAIVQGEAAAASIVEGIHALEAKQVDVMIVGRGGGTIEDLWAFNEEVVAQAVFDCSIPIISAVGHETDTTIIDYVADLRAPTPSAAAELAVFDVSLLQSQLDGMRLTLNRQIQGRLRLERTRLKAVEARLKMNSPVGKIREKKTYAMNLEERMTSAMRNQITGKRHRLAIYIEKLKGLSPLDKLNQGYSYISDKEGRTLTDINKVKIGDKLQIYVKNGRMEAEVTGKYPKMQ
ncbi:exodeoxyribonuclease VII large subunit [Parablautia intestinalis]|uniref:Exodeoxyribonuclease 7 large subunit n=1 Tax=Parablautia intestinalis TaxID=2320100 RepID=A0A3A9AQA9_9FIRM|nr:exodeoxyribonuclease VII large subunit [Parablautia intestinalis]RKI93582.1 exodeoxyribonuclease VII large subunit [Parablautia intestinalis]